jgi:hypothetical protein
MMRHICHVILIKFEILHKTNMRYLLLFILSIALYACNQVNESTSGQQQPGSGESKDNTELIKSINGRLHSALGNETVTRITEDHAYIFTLNDDNEELEFYFELGYDSEGWPMEGNVYYFNESKLIGYGYIHCDGCVGQDISSRLKSLEIKQFKSDDDLKEWDVIWSIAEPSSKLKSESSKILKKKLNTTQVEEKKTIVFIQKFGPYPNQFAQYRLVSEKNKVQVFYKYSDNKEMLIDNCEIRNNKLISLDNNGEYQIEEDVLCVYNPETDGYDCYDFEASKSTSTITDVLFNKGKSSNRKNNISSNVTIHKFKNNIYSINENGLETYLSFKESYSDKTGIMTLAQKGCKYVYNITMNGNKIEAKFFQSTCGAYSSNTTLYYEPNNNTLSMYINGEEFVFHPEF